LTKHCKKAILIKIFRGNNLTKSYGSFKAVDGISFEVHHGEIVGFLGPNGAGKTTTMRMITSYLFPKQINLKL
jgi:ABC-2 type transport system ATP-binding protein